MRLCGQPQEQEVAGFCGGGSSIGIKGHSKTVHSNRQKSKASCGTAEGSFSGPVWTEPGLRWEGKDFIKGSGKDAGGGEQGRLSENCDRRPRGRREDTDRVGGGIPGA